MLISIKTCWSKPFEETKSIVAIPINGHTLLPIKNLGNIQLDMVGISRLADKKIPKDLIEKLIKSIDLKPLFQALAHISIMDVLNALEHKFFPHGFIYTMKKIICEHPVKIKDYESTIHTYANLKEVAVTDDYIEDQAFPDIVTQSYKEVPIAFAEPEPQLVKETVRSEEVIKEKNGSGFVLNDEQFKSLSKSWIEKLFAQ